MRAVLELCCFNRESFRLAAEWKADRIELCRDRILGGTTPSEAEIIEALSLGLNTFPIIRPRGGDFVYTEIEFEKILSQTDKAIRLGVQGIVSGFLLKDGSIDEVRLKELLSICKTADFTFHRAFDVCNDPFAAIEILKKCGVKRILTSGTKANCKVGLPFLKEFVIRAEGEISIMAGGGLDDTIVDNLLEIGITEFHGSLINSGKEIPDKKIYQSILSKINS